MWPWTIRSRTINRSAALGGRFGCSERKPVKTRTKRLFLIFGLLGGGSVLGALGVSWLAYSVLSPNSARNQASARECTLEWGRLAPFPPSAQQLKIVTRGSPFTREFEVFFAAPREEIEEWLQQSPGTREATFTAPSPGVRHFLIAPGGGASFAEVTVDDTKSCVSIRVYWS
jgi:hypothetical protein